MVSSRVYKFCPTCGNSLHGKSIEGRLRPYCSACDWVYFEDPKVAAAVLVEQGGKVLLVRRVHAPEAGKWALPAGFVDAGENPQRAAKRECFEETGLEVEVVGLLDVFHGKEHPRGADIVIVYKAEVRNGELRPGDDAGAAAFFAVDEVPALAFRTTEEALAHWDSRSLP
jgi:ADP-ribose pyrophosphatase YjhB (NUDIX family)